MGSSEEPIITGTATQESGEQAPGGGYEPPSYPSYGYEPPSYEPPGYDPDNEAGENDENPKSKKKTIFDDANDDIPALKKPQDKSKDEKDKENAEMFHKIAEEEGKFDVALII
jgi:hypothetical protein